MTRTHGSGARTIVLDGVFIVRWSRVTSAEEVRTAIEALVEARRVHRRPLVSIASVHPDSIAPGEEAAREFMKLHHTFAAACSCLFLVLSPDSPHRQLQLAFAEAMRAFSPVTYESFDTLEEALGAAAVATGVDGESLLSQARARGAFDP